MEKYSLFLLEEEVYSSDTFVYNFTTKSCFEYVKTFDTLEEAKKEQKECELKSIILPSY